MLSSSQQLDEELAKASSNSQFVEYDKLDSKLFFVDKNLENQYVKYAYAEYGRNADLLVKVMLYISLIALAFNGFMFTFAYDEVPGGNDNTAGLRLITGLGWLINVVCNGIALRSLRRKWAQSSSNAEFVVTMLLLFTTCVCIFTLSGTTYDLPWDCIPEAFEGIRRLEEGKVVAESDWVAAYESARYCVREWSALYILLPLTTLFTALACIGIKLIRIPRFKVVLFGCTSAHAFRSLVLSPVASDVRFLWCFVVYVIVPYFMLRLARSQEASKRKLFVHITGLEKELGEAQRALVFEAPTAKEKAVVDAILGAQTMAGFEGLADVHLPFEALEFHERIGAGAFGEVIKATYGGSLVAVKRLLRARIDDKNIALIREEVLLLRQLRHPNIVLFVGASWNSVANICIVFEFLERGSLCDVLEDSALKLTWDDPKLKMMIDVGCGLMYLHDHQPSAIIHRDLKPDNVLVTPTFGCKLADFGASRAASDATMTVVGTASYVAPEVVTGEIYNEKVDIFGFGITLLQVHTQKDPYRVNFSAGAIQARVVKGRRPMMPADVPPPLRSLIEACWEQEPKNRPSSREVVAALRALQHEERVRPSGQVAQPPSLDSGPLSVDERVR